MRTHATRMRTHAHCQKGEVNMWTLEYEKGCPFTDSSYTPPEKPKVKEAIKKHIVIHQIEGGEAELVYKNEKQGTRTVRVVNDKPKNNYKTPWAALFLGEDSFLQEQATMEKPLTQTEYRVRDYVMSLMELGNSTPINIQYVGEKLRIKRQNVSKAIKRLVDLGIFIKGPKNGASYCYAVSPEMAFVGSRGKGEYLQREIKNTRRQGIIIDFNEFQELKSNDKYR